MAAAPVAAPAEATATTEVLAPIRAAAVAHRMVDVAALGVAALRELDAPDAASAAARSAVVAEVTKALADPDWDGDGCPDFGDDDYFHGFVDVAEIAAAPRVAPTAKRKRRGRRARPVAPVAAQAQTARKRCVAVHPAMAPALLAAA